MAKLGGFLKPNGDWISLPYYDHEPWAVQECLDKGWAYTKSATDVLFEHGYLQISASNAFFTDYDYALINLTSRQLDFLLIYASELNSKSRRILVDSYGLILPDTPATDFSVPLIAPSFDSR